MNFKEINEKLNKGPPHTYDINLSILKQVNEGKTDQDVKVKNIHKGEVLDIERYYSIDNHMFCVPSTTSRGFLGDLLIGPPGDYVFHFKVK